MAVQVQLFLAAPRSGEVCWWGGHVWLKGRPLKRVESEKCEDGRCNVGIDEEEGGSKVERVE